MGDTTRKQVSENIKSRALANALDHVVGTIAKHYIKVTELFA